MLKRAIELVQQHLQSLGHYNGPIDGRPGAGTEAGTNWVITQRTTELPVGSLNYPLDRRMILVLQLMCKDKAIDCEPIDGYWGPVTQNAYESLLHLLATGQLPPNWRDEEPSDANPQSWPRDTGNQAAMRAFYGAPGSPPIKKIRCPWTLRLAWDTSVRVTYVGCHAKVADSAERVLSKVHAHYGDAELKRLRLDLYGGCFFSRKKRGGSSWSTHAWAVALDWDPARNQLKWGRDRATLDHRDYDFWWRSWEGEGWVSLGRSRNFDWMHVQAARL